MADTKRPLDPNDAPEGYVAVAGTRGTCTGCAITRASTECWDAPPCDEFNRPDGCNVIFIKREDSE